MSTIISGSSPSITFSDSTTQTTAANITAPYTSNGVVYASSTSALATGSALTFNGTNLTVSGNITTGLKSSTFNTADQIAIIANTTWSGANPRLLVGVTKSSAGSGGLGIDASSDVTLFEQAGSGILTVKSTGVNVTGSTGLTLNTSNAGIIFNNSSALANSTLNDYETGTWTPNQGSGLTVVGAFSSAGYYTRVGNIVTINGYVKGATNVSCSVAGVICTNTPFAGGVSGIFWTGSVLSWDAASGASCGVQQNTNNIYNGTAVTASDRISFSITYRAF
jgi:hypothetical protein